MAKKKHSDQDIVENREKAYQAALRRTQEKNWAKEQAKHGVGTYVWGAIIQAAETTGNAVLGMVRAVTRNPEQAVVLGVMTAASVSNAQGAGVSWGEDSEGRMDAARANVFIGTGTAIAVVAAGVGLWVNRVRPAPMVPLAQPPVAADLARNVG